MEATAGERVVERDGLAVEVLAGAADVDDALAFLDRVESRVEAPLVDESERARLRALAGRDAAPAVPGAPTGAPDHWHPVLARRARLSAGYGGLVVPARGVDPATADLATDRDLEACTDVTTALFEALEVLSSRHRARSLTVWIRHAQDVDRDCANAAGFTATRRLMVLGRSLAIAVPAPDLPDAMRVRAFAPDGDEDAVVEVLRAAYAGTPDGGWDRARFRERRSYGWFDAADLLVAEDPSGAVVAIHWTKRRPDATGEVYNLAVHPDAQASGLGRALLRAGLRHLRARGCDDVILWVDEDNQAGRRLYLSEGFAHRWTDVAFATDLVGDRGPEA